MLKPKRKILRQEIEKDPFLETLFSIKQHFVIHKKIYLRSITVLFTFVLIFSFYFKSRSENATDASIVLNKAMVFMAQKDNLNAMIFLQEVNDKYIDTNAGLDASYYLGKIYFDREDYILSQSFFKQYTSKGSNKLFLGASCKSLSYIYEINGDLENAIKYQKLQLKYISSNLDKAHANINLAKIFFNMGDIKSAKVLIKQIIKDNSDDFEIIQLAEQAYGSILAK